MHSPALLPYFKSISETYFTLYFYTFFPSPDYSLDLFVGKTNASLASKCSLSPTHTEQLQNRVIHCLPSPIVLSFVSYLPSLAFLVSRNVVVFCRYIL